jgi:hypothetical protein
MPPPAPLIRFISATLCNKKFFLYLGISVPHFLIGFRIILGSWIRIRIKVKIQEPQRLKMEPRRAVYTHSGCMKAGFRIRINLSCWIRIQEGKNDPQK